MYFPYVSATAQPQNCSVPHQVLMQWPASVGVAQPQQSLLVLPSPTSAGAVLCPVSHCLGHCDAGRSSRLPHSQSHLPEPRLHQFTRIFPEWEVDELDFEDACTRMRDGARRAGISANKHRRRTTDQSTQCSLESVEEKKAPEQDKNEVNRVVGDINISGVVQFGQTDDTSVPQASGEHVDDADFDRFQPFHRPLMSCARSQPRQDSWSRYDLELKRFHKWRQEQQRPPLGRIPKHRVAFPQRSVSDNPASSVLQARVRRVYDHAHHTPLHPDDSYVYKFLDERRARHADAFSGVNTCSGKRRYDRPPPLEPYIPYDPHMLRMAGVQTPARPRFSAGQNLGREHRRKSCDAHSDGDVLPSGVHGGDLYPCPRPDSFHTGLTFKGKLRSLRQGEEHGSSGKASGKLDGLEKQGNLSGSVRIAGEDDGFSVSGSFLVPLSADEGRAKMREGTPPPWRSKN
ncbi:conserved hypothetical protein [Neospora caninum Liverpool]|uniref:Uncharacterized protein n=1 Tax=Neospora caninum (strain Liverpool) TaxID=572307 RepID=F0VNV1_NEOCL|nr:conserved hypothetical protein [Neospora caninum Liverpool]CBZ55397.1 conserved hypothetical protein [Neospora caninum Liverpool]CEL70133.1 TPA: hypothetical protein BN1204_058200 [Neospora caninum Liverpool]|eukprot:XP_003885425.1 conserved hypothetical protein [Neospora caninum Liverpool]